MDVQNIPLCCKNILNPITFGRINTNQNYITVENNNDIVNKSSRDRSCQENNKVIDISRYVRSGKIRHTKRLTHLIDISYKDQTNDIEKWFVVLLSRVNDTSSLGRTSIRLTTRITDIFNLQDINKHNAKYGWNIVFVLGPLVGVKNAISLSEKISANQKGIISKVATGEALAHVLGVTGFANWSLIFDCDVSYINPSIENQY